MSAEIDARIALVLEWTDLRQNTLWGDADMTGIPPGKLRTFVPRWSSSLDLMWELWAKEQYLWVQLNREQPMPSLVVWEAIVYNDPTLHDQVRIVEEESHGGTASTVLALAYLKVKEGKG